MGKSASTLASKAATSRAKHAKRSAHVKPERNEPERNERKRPRRAGAGPAPRRRRRSSTASSDSEEFELLETPPPPPALAIRMVGEDEDESPRALPENGLKLSTAAPEVKVEEPDFLTALPPPPLGPKPGPVCEAQTCTSFYFAGHLDNRTQWQILHQALVTYMYEFNMSPQLAWHNHRTGEFRGTTQKYTVLNVVTGSTWTNVFEDDMEGMIRLVWEGGDRRIEVYRAVHEG